MQPVHTPAAARANCQPPVGHHITGACTPNTRRRCHWSQQLRDSPVDKVSKKQVSLLRRVAELVEYAPQREEVAVEIADHYRARRNVQQTGFVQEAPPATRQKVLRGPARRFMG